MAQYCTKRKYTKKPTTKLKRVVRTVKTETVEPVILVKPTPVVKSFWQKSIDWVRGLVS